MKSAVFALLAALLIQSAAIADASPQAESSPWVETMQEILSSDGRGCADARLAYRQLKHIEVQDISRLQTVIRVLGRDPHGHIIEIVLSKAFNCVIPAFGEGGCGPAIYGCDIYIVEG